MKSTLPKPTALPNLNLLGVIKGFFVHQGASDEKRAMDSIFSLAWQRCAGYTTRPPARKEKDY